MELYTLDSLLRRERVIDRFDSLIWTERWQSLGDFELVIESTNEYRKYLQPGTWLSLSESYRCMRVETIEDAVDDEGRKILTVKGPSIEVLMEERTARQALESLTAQDQWSITGTAISTAREFFSDVCQFGSTTALDIIPYLTTTPIFPASSIPEPTGSVTITIDIVSVYEAVKYVCENYDFGFRLCRNPDSNQLKFDVYTGSDRTTGQSVLNPVIFSPDFDNLKNTTEFASTAGVKNIAYVFSPVGYEVVPAPNVDPAVEGFDRRVISVRADDIVDVIPANATAKMIQRGLEELAKYRDIRAFDGEVGQDVQYKYDTDYYLGDFIEMRASDGTGIYMRVTEQIFVADDQGSRAYPTFTAKELITPDTWLGWPNKVWYDYDTDSLHWAEA